MINKDTTRVDMSLKDYENLIDEIKSYRNLYSDMASSKYVEYEIDNDKILDENVEATEKVCTFKFNAKLFIEEHYREFYKFDDEILDYIEIDNINFKIKTK